MKRAPRPRVISSSHWSFDVALHCSWKRNRCSHFRFKALHTRLEWLNLFLHLQSYKLKLHNFEKLCITAKNTMPPSCIPWRRRASPPWPSSSCSTSASAAESTFSTSGEHRGTERLARIFLVFVSWWPAQWASRARGDIGWGNGNWPDNMLHSSYTVGKSCVDRASASSHNFQKDIWDFSYTDGQKDGL